MMRRQQRRGVVGTDWIVRMSDGCSVLVDYISKEVTASMRAETTLPAETIAVEGAADP